MRLRVHNKRQSKYYYALSRDEAVPIKFVGLLGLAATLLLAIGFISFAGQALIIAIICLPFFVVTIIQSTGTFAFMAAYPGFSLREHRQKINDFKKRHGKKAPRVAVFIPAAGEDIEVVRATTEAALRIKYPNFTVHVLDDSKTGMYRKLAKQMGVTYFRRRNIGFQKKAGNLNAATARLRGYNYILVLDADFIPKKEIIEELVPYMSDDVGIVQSPQHFDMNKQVYKRSKFEFGAALIQRDFYRITQVARSRLGGAICVGTNALYSVRALKAVGGYEGVGRPEWGHSEDVHTGLKMINTRNKNGDRYKITYVPIQLAKGVCPESHESFYRQQNRWASGSIQLLFSRLTIFSRELSLGEKFCYFMNPMYYLYTIAMLFTPVQLLILLLVDNNYDWTYTLLFLPMLIVTYGLVPFVNRRPIRPVATVLVVISNAYTFAQALIMLLMRRPLGWEPTGAQKRQSRSRHFESFKTMSSIFFILFYISTMGVLILNQRIGLNPSTFVISLFALAFAGHLIYLHHILAPHLHIQDMWRHKSAYLYVLIVIMLCSTGTISAYYNKTYDARLRNGVVAIVHTPSVDTAPVESQNQQTVTPSNLAENDTQDYKVVVKPGDNQSDIAREFAQRIADQKGLDQATRGKLQDRTMQLLGYRDFVAEGDTYMIDKNQQDVLLKEAYVFDHEQRFWASYAQDINL